MGYAPENTLASVKKAIDLKVDMIEVDVYYIDGELIVLHDDRLERTTNGTGYVWEHSFSELRKLDAGNGEKIPTLHEVVELIPDHIQINIEIKGRTAARPVVEFIQHYADSKKAKQRFLVSSFIHEKLKLVKNLEPDIRTAALCCAEPIKLARFASKLDACAVNPSIEFVSRVFVEDAHKRGLKVFVYTVNHPEDIERMRQLGVDGVFSNYPDRVNPD